MSEEIQCVALCTSYSSVKLGVKAAGYVTIGEQDPVSPFVARGKLALRTISGKKRCFADDGTISNTRVGELGAYRSDDYDQS